MRDDLAFGYLIGTKVDQVANSNATTAQRVDAEEASDMAYEHGLLFNEVASVEGQVKNIDLIVKTLRTRTSRLVSEIGHNLPSILSNLGLQI